MSSATPRATGAIGGREKVHGLVTEFLEEKKRDKEAEAATKAKRRASPWKLVVFAALAVGAWFYPFPPPTEPRPIPPLVIKAGVQMEVFMAAQRVRRYKAEHGRLPPSLASAGVNESWISIRPLDASEFEIAGTTDGVRVSYRSTMSDSAYFRETRALLGGSTN